MLTLPKRWKAPGLIFYFWRQYVLESPETPDWAASETLVAGLAK